jgi:hypothetical protein
VSDRVLSTSPFPTPPPSDAVPDARGRVRAPLVFGGIPEADGFARVPITSRDRVHFRVDRELPL